MDAITKGIVIAVAIVALLIGGGFGWLIRWGQDRVVVAEAKAAQLEAEQAKDAIQKQWEKAVNELNATEVLLNDTLAALELLKQYQAIDNQTQEDINKLKNTLDDEGNPTDKTKEEFRKLVDQFNQLNGNLGAMTTDLAVLDLKPFEKLKSDAEKLYNETQDMILELGIK